jgi:hypothetical protein
VSPIFFPNFLLFIFIFKDNTNYNEAKKSCYLIYGTDSLNALDINISASFKGRSDSMSKNKLLVPEAQQAINDLKTEIAQELGMPVINGTTSNMYPAIVNGLSVREMVRRGEQMLINKKAPSDTDIY